MEIVSHQRITKTTQSFNETVGCPVARILVIDDSPSAFAAVSEALTPEHHQISKLTNFLDLPWLLLDIPPDLILLDLQMPGFSGVIVGDFLQRYVKRRVPIVIYSSRPKAELLEAARQINAAAVFEKGGNPEELCKVVRDLLRQCHKQP